MNAGRLILVGVGHLAHRIRRLTSSRGAGVIELSRDRARPADESEPTFDSIVRLLRSSDLTVVTVAYRVDHPDEVNLEFLLALLSIDHDLPIARCVPTPLAPHR